MRSSLVRGETKPLEERSALTPATAKALIDAAYTLRVERSPVRIFEDAEFKEIGATLVPEGSWVDAPEDHLIIGLKVGCRQNGLNFLYLLLNLYVGVTG